MRLVDLQGRVHCRDEREEGQAAITRHWPWCVLSSEPCDLHCSHILQRRRQKSQTEGRSKGHIAREHTFNSSAGL